MNHLPADDSHEISGHIYCYGEERWHMFVVYYCSDWSSKCKDAIACVTKLISILVETFSEMPTILIFAESYPFSRLISALQFRNVKITARNKLKMISDKITGVTPTSTPVIPIHR